MGAAGLAASMRVMVLFSIHPIGKGAHVGASVAEAVRIIRASGLEHEVGPSGTTLLGDWDEVFACLKACHAKVGKGGVRVSSLIKVDQWDHPPGSIAAKVRRTEQRLAEAPAKAPARAPRGKSARRRA
jgi:uncharacterized protein (TIGR00106 family)